MPDSVVNLPGETWKPVVGCEGLYEVSNMGRVRSLPHPGPRPHRRAGRVLTPRAHSSGYARVNLSDRLGVRSDQYIHRLVLIAFTGEPPAQCDADHINGVRNDNRLANLRWLAITANRGHGKNRGASHHIAKLTDADVLAIRALEGTMSQAAIGRLFGVTQSAVWGILAGRRWKHVQG
jgi:hypothetical protein